MASVRKLYFKYGNQISSGVAEFTYDRIEDDQVLAPYFEKVDMAALREHVADLLCAMTGGPDLYKGHDMAVAHNGHEISADIFDRFVGHMAAAMDDVGIDAADSALLVTALMERKLEVIAA